MKRALIALGVVGCLLGSAAPASAAPLSACVNKRTGVMKLTAKKCKKGWKRVTWNKPGASGPQGPQGPTGPDTIQYVVRDSSGGTVGKFVAMSQAGATPTVIVERDDGWWAYSVLDGRLQATMGDVLYGNDTCTGQQLLLSRPADLAYWLGTVGGKGRAVERPVFPLAQPKAFRLTGTATQVATETIMYGLDWTGTCHFWSTARVGDYTLMFEPVTAPPDVAGPLSLS